MKKKSQMLYLESNSVLKAAFPFCMLFAAGGVRLLKEGTVVRQWS